MTTEEKAKAYDEALNWMREIYPGLHGATKEDAEHFFPELTESEDEKVRKWILEKMQGYASSGIPCSDEIKMADKAIDYLEKQKEQKPVEKHDLVAQLKEHLANTPKGQLEAEWKELEKWNHVSPTVEEYLRNIKLAEWSKNDEAFLKVAIAVCNRYSHKDIADWLKFLPERFNLKPKY
jgi:hypothetical protein